jgi:hypothetical protein
MPHIRKILIVDDDPQLRRMTRKMEGVQEPRRYAGHSDRPAIGLT